MRPDIESPEHQKDLLEVVSAGEGPATHVVGITASGGPTPVMAARGPGVEVALEKLALGLGQPGQGRADGVTVRVIGRSEEEEQRRPGTRHQQRLDLMPGPRSPSPGLTLRQAALDQVAGGVLEVGNSANARQVEAPPSREADAGGAIRDQQERGTPGLAPLQPGAKPTPPGVNGARVEEADEPPAGGDAEQAGGATGDGEHQGTMAGRRRRQPKCQSAAEAAAISVRGGAGHGAHRRRNGEGARAPRRLGRDGAAVPQRRPRSSGGSGGTRTRTRDHDEGRRAGGGDAAR